jgi:RNA polymerase sigma-70 factor (ECF subfamily)
MGSTGRDAATGLNGYAVDVDSALREYADMVYKIALSQTRNRYDADDVFQEVFLRFVTHTERITSEEHAKAWLIRVTLNCCKKHFRMWRRDTVELPENTPSMMPEEHEIIDSVLKLPHKYSVVIHLFYYESYSIREISSLLREKESTIKSRLSRGRGLLRETLKGEFGDRG